MRTVSGILCVLLALFALVQYDDPDPLFWGAVYGGAAFWAGLAAFRPRLLAAPPVALALAASAALAVALVIWLWPEAEGWWRQEVWWEDEGAREGMGAMIAAAVLALVGVQALRRRRRAGRAGY